MTAKRKDRLSFEEGMAALEGKIAAMNEGKLSLEETMEALDQAVKSGRALYAGLSNYNGETMERAAAILREEMMGCVQYAVPLTAEVNQGKNWLEAH